MSLKGKDIISIRDLTRNEIEHIMEVAVTMEPLMKTGSKILGGKILACLFFEPSTRTRLSFESAMDRLGGSCIGISEPRTSSIEKGESLEDTIRVVENYADAIVLRHPSEEAIRLAAECASIPVINGGSGAEEHPTQTILDLYTMKREMGKIDGLNIALLGDLKYGRTVHSLACALAHYYVNLYLVSPEPLAMPRQIIKEISGRIHVIETCDIEEIIPKVNILYVTRIQKERFTNLNDYERVKGAYRLTLQAIINAKKDMIIMHPLPRIDEISPEIDDSPHARYFKEVWYGVAARMALLSLIFGTIE
ncbi:MAG: aspartate carbamoyltransferase catalytic subunit [Thermoproteota archaeon]|nr:aspartate carbamoyltransferase catalytic subunit [Thermoproteota archaeon]